jgi:hypothetical protein
MSFQQETTPDSSSSTWQTRGVSTRKPDPRIIIGAIALQAVAGPLTVRDIARRTPEQVRGPRLLWKIWGGTNLAGAALYWLIGRRSTSAT